MPERTEYGNGEGQAHIPAGTAYGMLRPRNGSCHEHYEPLYVRKRQYAD